jgi:transcriptional regulator with XRE-family HTH domain
MSLAPPSAALPLEPADDAFSSRLARNLIAARGAAGWTQHQLAAHSRISRATIAQIETSASDPRLSTVILLAQALHVSPLCLLLGSAEIHSLEHLHDAGEPIENLRTLKIAAHESAADSADKTREIVKSKAAAVGAAIGHAIRPGRGAATGAALAYLIEQCATR